MDDRYYSINFRERVFVYSETFLIPLIDIFILGSTRLIGRKKN